MPYKKLLPYLINAITNISSFVVVVATATLFYFLFFEKSGEPEIYLNDGFCGVSENYFPQDEGDPNGKTIFRNKCAACHNKDMKSKLTGPALGGVTARWANYPKEDLHRWIRNSQGMIAEGHPKAIEVWNEWKPTVMNNFPELTDAEIEELLKYIESRYH